MVQSRLVSTLLSPALRLWLRSQVDSIESLTIDIEGNDRQILGGHIPGVALQAKRAIYQGLSLSNLTMIASTIYINIGQVIRGKPFKLLAPIPVETTLFLDADGLHQSASADLLYDALVELWQRLCKTAPELGERINRQQPPTLHCGDGYLEIHVDSSISSSISINVKSQISHQTRLGKPTHCSILRTKLLIVEEHLLEFKQTSFYPSGTELPVPVTSLDGFQIDLGRDVTIQTLSISTEGIYCQGRILVMP
ncbi:MAG: DUF2993 domain-containing protein [Cyanobacteria bacterium P01_F01_bin.150]